MILSSFNYVALLHASWLMFLHLRAEGGALWRPWYDSGHHGSSCFWHGCWLLYYKCTDSCIEKGGRLKWEISHFLRLVAWQERVKLADAIKCPGNGNVPIAGQIFDALWTKAVISLPQYTDTQIHKRWSDIALQRFSPKMMHLCFCFAKKVISFPWYTDTHYKMTNFICVFFFICSMSSLETGPCFVSPRDHDVTKPDTVPPDLVLHLSTDECGAKNCRNSITR